MPADDGVLGYFPATRGPWYGYLFALPVLLGYEVLELVFKPNWHYSVNGADAILTWFFELFGAQARFQVLLVVLILSGIFCWRTDKVKRQSNDPIRPAYFGFMLAESVVYAIFFGGVVSRVLGLLTGESLLQLNGGGGGPLYRLAMSLGAGLYEELLFRVLLMGGLAMLLIKAAKMDRLLAWIISAVLSAFLFSAFHYVGSGAYPFTLESFLWRFVAGGMFAVLYGVRGFGIVVWTHALYDALVLLVLGGGSF